MARKRGPRRRTYVPRRLKGDRIVAEAIALADKAGLAAISMRKLAESLGVEAMSLYNHVPNKEALIDLMVDRVVGEIALPDPGRPWRNELRRRAQSALSVLMGHPWLALPMVSRMNTGPCMLTYMDRTHGCLLAAGFDHASADRARHLMDSHIHGYALQEMNFPLRPEDYAASAAAFMPQLTAAEYPHLRSIAEAIVAGVYDGRISFAFGLELILDGLERKLR
jgi:AcrR family transcriptional regulator